MSQLIKNSNKYTALAVAVALGLHGLAGFGLATMKMLIIEPPKIVPPIEIQMLTITNHEESPEPPKPVVAPVVIPKPTPALTPKPSTSAPQASPAPAPASPPVQKLASLPPKAEPKPEPSKAEPIKKEPPKTEPKT
ncbi:MAG: hypothetical protein Q3971_05845, partial [Moraxella sp.]|nr:hypothetical protein [Moraxella sp.]